MACTMGIVLLDHAGRRALLIWGTAGLAVCSLCFGALAMPMVGAALDNGLGSAPSYIRRWAVIFLLGMITQSHFGPVAVKQISICEMLPQASRASGVALCMVLDQMLGMLVAISFLPAAVDWGVGPCYLFFGVCGVVTTAAMYAVVPETAHARVVDLAITVWRGVMPWEKSMIPIGSWGMQKVNPVLLPSSNGSDMHQLDVIAFDQATSLGTITMIP